MFNWWKKRQEKKILDVLALELNKPDSEVSKRVNLKSNMMTVISMMRWLDVRRIRHCALCPSTTTLRSAGGQYYCPDHVGTVKINA